MSAARDFQIEMARESIKEVEHDLSYPCCLCGHAPCGYMGLWIVNREFGRKIGVPEGKTLLFPYKLCRKCERKVRRNTSRYSDPIERAVLKHHGYTERHA